MWGPIFAEGQSFNFFLRMGSPVLYYDCVTLSALLFYPLQSTGPTPISYGSGPSAEPESDPNVSVRTYITRSRVVGEICNVKMNSSLLFVCIPVVLWLGFRFWRTFCCFLKPTDLTPRHFSYERL